MTGNHVLVRPEAPIQTGLIQLTERMKFSMELGRPRVWTVEAVGPGRTTRRGCRIPVECQPGDRVITHSYTEGPTDLPDGRAIITADQIIAVLPS